MTNLAVYREFLKRKVALETLGGFPCEAGEVSPILKPHQRDIVCWAVRGGKRAIFTAFGLGKTVIQLETLRLVLKNVWTLNKATTPRGLITMPLGVRQEFKRDAAMLGTPVRFIRSNSEIDEPGIYLTNYESVRDGKLDPTGFDAVSLDEAGILRGFGATKTFREFMRLFEGTSTYRFVATATPSPNEYIELLSYAAFLGIMDVGQAKTRFFKRDSTKADQLTLHPHKEREFWLWVSSWAMFLQKPSDLGYSDEGYELPPLDIRWHELPSNHAGAGEERGGQGRLIRNAAIGVTHAAREKRDSIGARIGKLLELRAEDPGAHRIIWHDLERERAAINEAVPEAAAIYGSQDLDEREQAVIDFSDGKIQDLAAKPVIAGSGCNFQRHCSWAIFLGVGFKFNDFIQAIHRIHRFLQPGRVRIDLIYTEAEREVKAVLKRKWQAHNTLVAKMTEIIREYGLSQIAMAGALTRSMGIEPQIERGTNWALVNDDAVEHTAGMAANSVDLIVTSIPFSTQYEYTPSYNDFGHTEDNPQFWEQMDFLTPELYRVLQPGRVACVHVKDRIAPGGLTGLGFQTAQPFHAEAIFHFIKHGFAYMGMKTVVTDVVRENNQTYRLGWSEQCKDGTKMGWGMPEYVLLFRKPPTDRSNGYADVPVAKKKPVVQYECPACYQRRANKNDFIRDEDENSEGEWETIAWACPDCGIKFDTSDDIVKHVTPGFSLGRWQIDAHGFARSSGNRFLAPGDLHGLTHAAIYKLFRRDSLTKVYGFHAHVALCDWLQDHDILPVTFQLLPPHSWHPDVWTDVARMRTLNGQQAAKNKAMHLCPLQFDIVDRLITQFSMEGETVYDPFAGLGTVPYCAVKLSRRGLGVELNPAYWSDSIYYLRQAEESAGVPSLFDLEEVSAEDPEEAPA